MINRAPADLAAHQVDHQTDSNVMSCWRPNVDEQPECTVHALRAFLRELTTVAANAYKDDQVWWNAHWAAMLTQTESLLICPLPLALWSTPHSGHLLQGTASWLRQHGCCVFVSVVQGNNFIININVIIVVVSAHVGCGCVSGIRGWR